MLKIKKIYAIVLIFAIIISFIIPYVSTINDIKTYTISSLDEFTALLQKEIPKKLDAYNLPGVAVALAEKGSVAWERGFTNNNINKGITITANTAFQAASISKPVAAWAVMKLVEEGKLDLDAPIDTYLRRWKLPPSKFDNGKVTIRKILSHTAGLSAGGYKGYDPEQKLPSLVESLSGSKDNKYKVQLVNEPGSAYSYSGGGYTILQLVIEEATGMSFANYMEFCILEPLGMKNSSYIFNNRIQRIAAAPHGDYGQVLPHYAYTEKAAAGLYTTAHDLIKFVIANFSYTYPQPQQTILKPENIKLMHTKTDESFPFALGFMMTDIDSSEQIIEHRGTNRGWRNKILFNPQQGDGIVILTNSDMGRDLQYDIEMIWLKWKCGKISKELRSTLIQRLIIDFVTLMLLFVLIIYIIKALVRIFTKKHVFVLKKRKKMTIIDQNSLILPLSSIFYWWFIFYSSYILRGWVMATFVTIRFANITLLFILWCICIVLNRFFREMEVE